MSTFSLQNYLPQCLEVIGVTLDEKQKKQIIDYIQMLIKWNRTFNLTSIVDEKTIVHKHIADTLLILPHLVGNSLIDIGTGAGIPGLILAIAKPELNVTLIDKSAKKCRFLRHASHQLGTNNVLVYASRSEEFAGHASYDIIISRAFSSINNMIHFTKHLCHKNSEIHLMKSELTQKEISEIPDDFEINATIKLPNFESIPELQLRHLVKIKKKSS